MQVSLGPLIHPLTYRESFYQLEVVGCVADFNVRAEISSHLGRERRGSQLSVLDEGENGSTIYTLQL